MRYVTAPRELAVSQVKANNFCLAPGKYVYFTPTSIRGVREFVPLDKLVVLSDTNVQVQKRDLYCYAEIGDINVHTGGIHFREMRGYKLPSKTVQKVQNGSVLISTVRTYRRGVGYVSSEAPNLVATKAFLNICGVTPYISYMTLLYVYSFLRSDFFIEQVWSMLNRGMYPRMDEGTLDRIFIPIPTDSRVVRYISSIEQAIIDKDNTIHARSLSE